MQNYQEKDEDKKDAFNKSLAEATEIANKKAEERAAEANRRAEEVATRVAATKNNNTSNKGTQTVKVSDFDMPFGSMIVFMVKWAIASIPAILILMVLFFIFGGLLGILT
jgi:type IV secretory pathway VirB10-like protein